MPCFIEHIEAARRGLHIVLAVVVAVPRVQECLPVLTELLFVIQHSRPCGNGDLLPIKTVVALAVRRRRETVARICVCTASIKCKVALSALVLRITVAREEVRRALCALVIDIDIEVTRRQFLVLDRRLALNVLRIDANAPRLVLAKALTDVDRLTEGTARVDRLLVRDALLAVLRLLRHEVDRAARRLRVRRSMDADRRTRDHLDALHEVRRHIRLREQPRHAVDLELIRVHLEAADRVVVVHRARTRAHGRRHEQRVRQWIRAVVILRKRLLRDVRLTERDIHHVLRAEESRSARAAHECILLLSRRALSLHIDRCEFVGIHPRRLLGSTCRPHPHRANRRERDCTHELSFCHLHFPPRPRRTNLSVLP